VEQLRPTDQFDLAVIGVGIIGATTAYLAHQKQPKWRLLLVDRSFIASGATQYSAGLDIPYGRTASQKRYSRMSTRIYRKLALAMPDLPIYRIPLFGIVGKKTMAKVRSKFTTPIVRIATRQEEAQLRRTYPDLAIAENQVLLTGCTAQYSFPATVASKLVGHLTDGGFAECWEGVEIESVHNRAGGFVLSTSDGRTVSARRVLTATGPWLMNGPAGRFARNEGVRIKKIVALHASRRSLPNDPVLCFLDDDAFILPVYQRQQWLFSFASQEWDCRPETSRLRISGEDRDLALSILNRYCPSIVPLCHGGRVFCDAYSRDGVPLVAQVPGMPNFVMAGAGSGSGYRLAPGIAIEALKQLS
jgi:glycine/D-amino acid oxidase-like deaminating enzyme